MLRAFREPDAPACAAIVTATPLWARYGLIGARAAELLLCAAAAGDPVLVLEDGGGVAGFAWIMERGAFGRAPYLRLIAVDPRRRGAGLGTRLLAAAEVRAAEVGRDFFLLVSDFNEGARRFYARAGWTEVGGLTDLVLQGVTEVLMHKRVG
jgi:GNAT superfamily N-acetyltransferase